MKRFCLASLALLLMLAAGCAGSLEVTSAAPGDRRELVAGNGRFAFDLYQRLRSESGNLFCSPYSISAALAMTYAGARGATEQEMAKTLHFTLAQARLHQAFNWADSELKLRGKGARGARGNGFQLRIVNALWGQTGHRFLPTFLDLLSQNYGAGMKLLDFAKNPEGSRLTINRWVEQQTERRIKDLLPAGSIHPLVPLVLTNAIYFDSAWAMRFEKKDTRPGPFTLLDEKEVTVDMMSRGGRFRYARGEGYQAIELEYDGREMAMDLLLPDAGRFKSFEASLTAAKVEAILKSLQATEVRLVLPKFTFESGFALREKLGAMGMSTAFGSGADFSGMDGTHELFIDNVYHKAFVRVDEEGTEAAAATAVVMGRGALRPRAVQMIVDRPFVFVIRDLKTGTILFLGRVLNPLG
jgi:serpin B